VKFEIELNDMDGKALMEMIGNNDSADDMKNVDLTKIHYLSGPFEIEGAEPGDVLVVDICDVQPHQNAPWFVYFHYFFSYFFSITIKKIYNLE